jgi:hypothetical protein
MKRKRKKENNTENLKRNAFGIFPLAMQAHHALPQHLCAQVLHVLPKRLTAMHHTYVVIDLS